jgi:hypothetical protein
MAFDQLRNVVDNIKRIDPSKIVIKQMSTPESKKLIIQLNTIGQLFQKGEDSRGIRLDVIGGGYTEFTQAIKRSNNQPINRVTLNDTGEFYGSWKVTTEGSSTIVITADPIKDDTNLFDRWGEEIVGLQDESLLILIDTIINEFVEDTKIEILKGA